MDVLDRWLSRRRRKRQTKGRGDERVEASVMEPRDLKVVRR